MRASSATTQFRSQYALSFCAGACPRRCSHRKMASVRVFGLRRQHADSGHVDQPAVERVIVASFTQLGRDLLVGRATEFQRGDSAVFRSHCFSVRAA